MTKTKLILVAAFLVTLAAGFAAGYTLGSSPRPRHGGSVLVSKLDLTPDQRDKATIIWQEADAAIVKIREHGDALRTERGEAVRTLLGAAEATQYDAIQQEYHRKADELTQERRKVFEQARAKTNAILTPDQRKKYEELLRSDSGREHRRPAGDGKESPKPGAGASPAGATGSDS